MFDSLSSFFLSKLLPLSLTNIKIQASKVQPSAHNKKCNGTLVDDKISLKLRVTKYGQ